MLRLRARSAEVLGEFDPPDSLGGASAFGGRVIGLLRQALGAAGRVVPRSGGAINVLFVLFVLFVALYMTSVDRRPVYLRVFVPLSARDRVGTCRAPPTFGRGSSVGSRPAADRSFKRAGRGPGRSAARRLLRPACRRPLARRPVPSVAAVGLAVVAQSAQVVLVLGPGDVAGVGVANQRVPLLAWKLNAQLRPKNVCNAPWTCRSGSIATWPDAS